MMLLRNRVLTTILQGVAIVTGQSLFFVSSYSYLIEACISSVYLCVGRSEEVKIPGRD